MNYETRIYFDTATAVVSVKQPSSQELSARIDNGKRFLYAPRQVGTVSIHALNGKRIGTVELHHGQAELPALQRGLYILRLPNGPNLKWNYMDD